MCAPWFFSWYIGIRPIFVIDAYLLLLLGNAYALNRRLLFSDQFLFLHLAWSLTVRLPSSIICLLLPITSLILPPPVSLLHRLFHPFPPMPISLHFLRTLHSCPPYWNCCQTISFSLRRRHYFTILSQNFFG